MRWQGAPCARPSHHPSNSARFRPKSAPDITAEARSTTQVNEGGRNRRTTPTTRLTCHPALVRSADIAITRRAQRAPTCVDDQKRPRSSARSPALSSNQLRRALQRALSSWRVNQDDSQHGFGNRRSQRPSTVPGRIATTKILAQQICAS